MSIARQVVKSMGPVVLCCAIGVASFAMGHRPVPELRHELDEARATEEKEKAERDRFAADLSAITQAAQGHGAEAAQRISTLQSEVANLRLAKTSEEFVSRQYFTDLQLARSKIEDLEKELVPYRKKIGMSRWDPGTHVRCPHCGKEYEQKSESITERWDNDCICGRCHRDFKTSQAVSCYMKAHAND